MRKIVGIALVMVLVLSLAACGGGNASSNDTPLTRPSSGSTASSPPPSAPAANIPDTPDIGAILSGSGGDAPISGYDEATKQAFIDEAKADGYEITFAPDGSMRMEDTQSGEVIIQKPDGTWTVEVADDGGDAGGNIDVDFGGNWPDNDFTRLVPKPEFNISFSNSSEVEFTAMLDNVDTDKMKAYVEEIKKNGFTQDEVTTDQEVMGTVIYAFSAKNADGYTVSVAAISGGQYTLSITAP